MDVSQPNGTAHGDFRAEMNMWTCYHELYAKQMKTIDNLEKLYFATYLQYPQ